MPRVCVCVCVYLPKDALVVAGAECGDDTHTIHAPVKPLLTDAGLGRGVAAVHRRGVDVLAAPLTWQRLAPPPPLLSGRARCRGDGGHVSEVRRYWSRDGWIENRWSTSKVLISIQEIIQESEKPFNK